MNKRDIRLGQFYESKDGRRLLVTNLYYFDVEVRNIRTGRASVIAKYRLVDPRFYQQKVVMNYE